MLSEDEIRKKVKVLKRFYMDIVNFIVVNVALTFVWFTFDKTGNFWPKYVILVWGTALLFRAYRMGIFALIFPRITMFGEDWEEKKVQELIHRRKREILKDNLKNEKKKKK